MTGGRGPNDAVVRQSWPQSISPWAKLTEELTQANICLLVGLPTTIRRARDAAWDFIVGGLASSSFVVPADAVSDFRSMSPPRFGSMVTGNHRVCQSQKGCPYRKSDTCGITGGLCQQTGAYPIGLYRKLVICRSSRLRGRERP